MSQAQQFDVIVGKGVLKLVSKKAKVIPLQARCGPEGG